MCTTPNIRFALKTAIEVPKWAFRFYLQHFLLIAGISVLPSLERFILLYFQPDWSDILMILLEGFTESLRLLLLWLIIRLAVVKNRDFSGLSRSIKWQRVKAFFKYQWLNLVFQLLFLCIASVIFDVFPKKIADTFVAATARSRYLAILLAIKNPTVIAWVIVWLVGIPRQMMYYPVHASKQGEYVPIS